MTRLALVAAALLTGVAGAEAMHAVEFRYVVLGYVKSAQGRPLRETEVRVMRDKTGFTYFGDTDDQGFYVIIARLGDESRGETLTLQIAGAETRVTVKFNPKNHDDERGTRVDLEGRRFVERSAWFPSTLARFLERPAR